MEKIFNTLGTDVYYCKNTKELSLQISNYGPNVIWILDDNTAKLLNPLPFPNVILKPGENYKNWKSIEEIVTCALKNSISRDSMFVSLGGGVVCDLTAFAASIYMRGANLTLIPTTLLCMVDASLGGKTGMDFENGKNIIGTFNPANEVLICPSVLKTLPLSEYRSGLAEVLKHSLLSSDNKLFNLLKNHKDEVLMRDEKILKEMLILSLEVKKSFIERDPKEKKGIRQALNLGHTFGHALESFSRMAWPHGNAVAWGTVRALHAGLNIGVTPHGFANEAINLFKLYDYDINYRLTRADWYDYRQQLSKDKKRYDGKIKFVLSSGQGKFVLQSLEDKQIKEVVLRKPL